MIKKLIPDDYYNSIDDIPFTKLYDAGYRLILTDLDNTIVSYKVLDPTLESHNLKKKLEDIGFEVIIVSNSKKDRVDRFASELGLPYVKNAMKPLKKGYKRAIKKVASKKYSKNEIFTIGDQIMTDIFGSKRLGLTTVLVKAIDRKTEVWTTRFNRKMEKFFIRRIKNKMPNIYKEKLEKYVGDTYDSEEM